MPRFFLTLTLVASLILVAGAVAAPVSGAQVDAPVPTNQTATATPEPDTVAVELGPTLRITDHRYEGGTWYISVESDTAGARLTVTDAAAITEILADGEGAASGTASARSYTVTSGETVIQMDATEYQGMAAVIVSSNRGDRLAVFRTEALSTGRSPVPYDVVGALLVTVFGATAYATYRYVARKKDEEGQRNAERVV